MLKTFLVLTVLLFPCLSHGSFYENCLLVGHVQSLSQGTEGSPSKESFVFVPKTSYSLANSQRKCDYWVGREMDVSLNTRQTIEQGQQVSIHYEHSDSLCEGETSCTQTLFTLSENDTLERKSD